MKRCYKIYNQDELKQLFWKIVCWLLLLVGLIMLILYFVTFGDLQLSDNHKYWVESFTILSSAVTVMGTGLLIININEGQKAVRKANTLPVCIDIFKELRSSAFLKNEEIIRRYLDVDTSTSRAIKNKELTDAIRSYLHIMNKISTLVIQDIIDDEPIIAYKGIDILYYYNLLEPYIVRCRSELYNHVRRNPSIVDCETRRILLDSSSLCYAHYELFIKQIKIKSPYLLGQFKEKIRN